MSYFVVAYWVSQVESTPRPRMGFIQHVKTLRGAAISAKAMRNWKHHVVKVFDAADIEELLPEVVISNDGMKMTKTQPKRRKNIERCLREVG